MGSTSFLGFSLLLVFLNYLLFLGTCFTYFFASVGTSSGSFILLLFSVPYFGLACDQGNSFLCLEEKERECIG